MRKVWVVASALVVLVLVNLSIAMKEYHLAMGEVVYLELAPVDPRSLMQGDYMALRFALQNDIRNARQNTSATVNGTAIVRLDENRVAQFVRLDDADAPLAENEIRLQYRIRNHWVKIATNAFFFREGTADRYEAARYGRFRVNDDGAPLLVSLHDESLNNLGEMDRGL
ncbi:GDYXXLXY domain-containing protein [Saccharospirillum salsuginis]|uniref:Membrane-anchored protein n=1 Tax=Saccharospirillum salsuginis TaxID=418750 RepID=A0A918N7F8_9GAMM|nr:GDYXXLXY domain-containing protein [Saccharospirillum salsuginis]GGX43846.1 hypothetical protein GCM10007392_08250 [Saccharospirillum salsuginis]